MPQIDNLKDLIVEAVRKSNDLPLLELILRLLLTKG